MAQAYAKIENCLDILPSLKDATENFSELEASLEISLLDASRQFESETFVGTDYYAKAGANATDRIFYGNGTAFLRLPPFVTLNTITDAEDEILVVDENYRYYSDESRARFYVRFHNYPYRCGYSLAFDNRLTINAQWGWSCIPPDVVVAVKNRACQSFLTNPQNRMGQTPTLSEELDARLQSTYNRILEIWKMRIRNQSLGIG